MRLLVFIILLLFLGCKSAKKWEVPRVGERYVHSPYEEVKSETPDFIKYSVRLDFNSDYYRTKTAFITVKNDTVVAVWIGPRGY